MADRKTRAGRLMAGGLAALILATGVVIAGGTSQIVDPGTSLVLQCPTEFTGSFSKQEVTLECASAATPAPTATPEITPSPTATPSPTPTASPTPTPSSTPTPQPTATPAVTPAPPGGNVSGKAIPPPLPGLTRIHFTEFPNSQALGQPPHPDTARFLVGRPNIAGDCTYNDSSGRGRYCWKATTSEHGGMLDQWLHTETGSCRTSGFTFVHNGNGGCNYVSGPISVGGERGEFMVSFVAKFDDIPGRKVAYLRWCGPKIGTPGYCEDNFPEGKLEPGPRGNIFHHHHSSGSQNQVSLNIEFDQWHLYQMHVKPCQFVDFYLDGVLKYHATQAVSCDTSYWVGQSETYLNGQAIPIPHNQGHLLWDNFAMDVR